MRDVSLDMQAHLDAGVTTLCWCWKLIRTDGQEYGFTDHDGALEFDGLIWQPDTGLAPGMMESQAGFETASAGEAGIILDGPFTETDLLSGRFDGARVEIWRVNWQEPAQRLCLWAGELGEIHLQGNTAQAELVSVSRKLERTIGRKFSQQCDAELGDERCGVDLSGADFQLDTHIDSLTDAVSLLVPEILQIDAGWFNNGLVFWLDAARDPHPVRIRDHTRTDGFEWLRLQAPPRVPAQAGDAVRLRVGCDKTAAQCAGRFGNLVNFRGCPFMPGNDVLMAVPYAAH